MRIRKISVLCSLSTLHFILAMIQELDPPFCVAKWTDSHWISDEKLLIADANVLSSNMHVSLSLKRMQNSPQISRRTLHFEETHVYE